MFLSHDMSNQHQNDAAAINCIQLIKTRDTSVMCLEPTRVMSCDFKLQTPIGTNKQLKISFILVT